MSEDFLNKFSFPIFAIVGIFVLYLYNLFTTKKLKQELNTVKDINVNNNLVQKVEDIQTQIQKVETLSTHTSESPDQLTKDLNKI